MYLFPNMDGMQGLHGFLGIQKNLLLLEQKDQLAARVSFYLQCASVSAWLHSRMGVLRNRSPGFCSWFSFQTNINQGILWKWLQWVRLRKVQAILHGRYISLILFPCLAGIDLSINRPQNYPILFKTKPYHTTLLLQWVEQVYVPPACRLFPKDNLATSLGDLRCPQVMQKSKSSDP